MRVFLAIELPENIRSEIYGTVQPYLKKLNCKPVEKENLHVTIKFYGEIPPQRVDEIGKIVSEVTQMFNKFEMEIKGSGVFPETGTPRVLWIGVDKMAQSLLKQMFTEIELRSRKAGFRAETKAYHPHVTVARLKPPVNMRIVERFLNELSGKSFGKVEVRTLTLFQSILTFDGPIYQKIAEFEL
jgi:2'-5' RNA ligase